MIGTFPEPDGLVYMVLLWICPWCSRQRAEEKAQAEMWEVLREANGL
jgi:hypothetical protein